MIDHLHCYVTLPYLSLPVAATNDSIRDRRVSVTCHTPPLGTAINDSIHSCSKWREILQQTEEEFDLRVMSCVAYGRLVGHRNDNICRSCSKCSNARLLFHKVLVKILLVVFYAKAD